MRLLSRLWNTDTALYPRKDIGGYVLSHLSHGLWTWTKISVMFFMWEQLQQYEVVGCLLWDIWSLCNQSERLLCIAAVSQVCFK